MYDRGRGSRQLVQLGTMAALVAIGVSQLVTGPVQSTPINTLPDPVQRTFAAMMILSAMFVLAGAILSEPRAYWVEVGGQFGAAATLTVYTLTLKGTVPQWETSMGAGFGYIAFGCYGRMAWLTLLIVANFYPRLFRVLSRAYVGTRSWWRRWSAAAAALLRRWRR